MPFPDIDPIALQLGPLIIRWYALAYIAGILLGWWWVRKLQQKEPLYNLTDKAMENMLTWAVVGIIGGGRLGYVMFYKPAYYLDHPLEALQIWQGGMSFHGGMLGVIAAFFFFSRHYNIPFMALMDRIAAAAPFGLFFGRIANFINGELYGRVTDSPLGVIFPGGGPYPRHPSQLYEALLEGLVLFFILAYLALRTHALHKPGMIAGIFLLGYGTARCIAEFFREPDAHLGFIVSYISMGQILSLPMILGGIGLIWLASRGIFAFFGQKG